VILSLHLDLRAVFVVFELEEMSTSEIAVCIDVPVGTVASRLRRARERFSAQAMRVRMRGLVSGGER
jgi:RNA polymerase sigma-70 factor (ECF subfamily)